MIRLSIIMSEKTCTNYHSPSFDREKLSNKNCETLSRVHINPTDIPTFSLNLQDVVLDRFPIPLLAFF